MKIDIDWRPEFLQGFTPTDYAGDDHFLRLPNDHRLALLKLLGALSRNDMVSRGLSDEQSAMLYRIYNSLG